MGWKSWFVPLATLVSTYIINGTTELLGLRLALSIIPLPIDEQTANDLLGSKLFKNLFKNTPGVGSGLDIFMSIFEFFGNLGLLWLANFAILLFRIWLECGKFPFGVAATNAWGGAIAASVALLIFRIILMLTDFIPAIGQLIAAIEMFLFFLPFLILIIFNMSFGAGLANAIALKQGCPKEEFEPNPNPEAHSHSHSHANYGPYDRCRCTCCPVCNKL